VHGWLYSNTNYILLGMIIREVTGQGPVTEIGRRILKPLGLRDTSFPLTSTEIPGPYAHGYYGSLDVTNLVNPSTAWTAGAMISTAGNVAEFYRALLTGRLLPPAERRGLLATIPVNDTGELFAEHYGLGIYSVRLACPRSSAMKGRPWKPRSAGGDDVVPAVLSPPPVQAGRHRWNAAPFGKFKIFITERGAYPPRSRRSAAG
jgi:D-alanyl-D-alanine carboxypeptidase